MFSVYVIKSAEGFLYIGQTGNLEKRLQDHNSGLSLYTKRSSGWKLLYSEDYATRSEAFRRERWLKTGKGREYLRRILID